MRDFTDTIPWKPLPYQPANISDAEDTARSYEAEEGREDGGLYVIAWGAALLILGCVVLALWLARTFGG